MKYSIITVDYKATDEVQDLKASLAKHTNITEYELIVIDNNKDNVGFARGCNKGARKAKGEYLIFLNPDCRVGKNWIKELTAPFKENKYAGITGARLTDENGLEYMYKVKNLVSGACMCIKRELFTEIKGFDERYFFTWEDNDLCHQAYMRGYDIVHTNADVMHKGGKSMDKDDFTQKHLKHGAKLFNYKFPRRHSQFKKRRVLIAVPTYKYIEQDFFFSFVDMMSYNWKNLSSHYEFYIAAIRGQQVKVARNNAIQMALDNDCDYIMMIDDDMVPPTDTFEKLVSHKKDMVGALCFTRGEPHTPVIYKIETKGDKLVKYETIYKWEKGLIPVDGIGFGCVLIDMKVIKEGKLKQPYFWEGMKPSCSEDIYFCMNMNEAGYKIYCDTDCEVGHLGNKKAIGTSEYKHMEKIGRIDWHKKRKAQKVFVHIPKTGGSSLYAVSKRDFNFELKDHDTRKEDWQSLEEYKKDYAKNGFYFTIMRDPLKRAISAFAYLTIGGNNTKDKRDAEIYVKRYKGNFKKFCRQELTKDRALKQIHFRPQHEWICDSSGKLLVDKILRQENLQEEYQKMCKNWECEPTELSKRNVGEYKFEEPDEETIKIIKEVYKKDYQILKNIK